MFSLQTDSLRPLTAALNLAPKRSNKAHYLDGTLVELKKISLHNSVPTSILLIIVVLL